ncbi:MAG: ATPase, T2SS/T4P/T4SS family [Planctomycetota bacterium]
MPSLIVRDSKNGRVKEIQLTKRRFTIGSSDYNDLVLTRSGVAKEHCVLVQKDDGFVLRDLTIKKEKPLTDGSRFEVATFEVQFRGERQRSTSATKSQPSKDSRASVAGAPTRRGRGSKDQEPTDPLIRTLRAVHQRLLEAPELKRVDFDEMDPEVARRTTERVLVQIIKDMQDAGELAGIDRRALLKQALNEALGLGPLEELLADDDISEIMVNSAVDVFVERRGHGMVRADVKFSSDEQVMHVIRRIVAPIGRRINEQTPLCDGRLADGSRINAVIPPLAVSGPSLTIRKFPKDRLGIEDLIKFGSLTKPMGDFLEIAVREHMNICISGGTGSGKTTLLNVVSSFIGKSERIVTVEDVSELKLPQEHIVTLEARPPNLEGEGAITIRDLVKNCLRMRPDRIVVGECRGGEALDMLQAMNTGHDGSLTTIHSNSPRDCIARLETLVLLAGMDLPSKAIREQIASAVHMIIQQTRLPDGSRKVTYISRSPAWRAGWSRSRTSSCSSRPGSTRTAR